MNAESITTTSTSIGNVNIGWTVGEEILFDKNMQIRPETCYADTESCLLGMNKGKLNLMQKKLLEQGNTKDYQVIETVLKGNYMLKNNWRKDLFGGNKSMVNTGVATPSGSIRHHGYGQPEQYMNRPQDQIRSQTKPMSIKE